MSKMQKNNNVKRSGSTKGSRSRTKYSSKERKDDVINSKVPACNDVSWYAKNEQILKDTASFSFNNPLGAAINWLDHKTAIDLQVDQAATAIPGIMSLDIMPAFGISKDNFSPLNIAAQNIYSYVRFHNSGAANYDQPDLMLYLLSLDSCYYMWNYLQRAYGVMTTYSQTNRYLPRALFEAMGLDFEDFSMHLADFRAFLNITAAKLSAFCVPGNLPYITRHSWLFSNIYADSQQSKAQLYMFNPTGCYWYNETSSSNGGFLEWRSFKLTNKLRSYTEVTTFINDMMARLLLSEDIGIMSGDIKKAYGDSGLFTLSRVDDSYVVMPVYNPEVLSQIHNSVSVTEISGAGFKSGSLNVTQDPDTNALLYNPQADNPCLSIPRMINMYSDSVTPAEVMVGTRLSIMVSPNVVGTADAPYYEFAALGSDFVYRYLYTTIVNGEIVTEFGTSFLVSETEGVFDSDKVNNVAKATNFDFHPLVYLIEKANITGSPYYLRNIIGDISNYTLMDSTDLQKLHETAILSMFNIPQLGAF